MSELSPLLRIENITIRYGEKTVLKDFSLTLNKGGRVIVAGPNGSGKTTLLKSILGIVKTDGGIIEKAESMRIAYTRQGETKPDAPISVREVVAMGLYRAPSKDYSIIEKAMKATKVAHLSSRSFSSLSGGEKQRVQIARCIAQKADLLLMDEPTSYLDEASSAALVSILQALGKDMAAVIVTHDGAFTEKLGWPVIRIKEEESCRG